MTKRTLYVKLNQPDWVDFFRDKTVGEAVKWLQQFNGDVQMGIVIDHDHTYGRFYERREDAGEEFVTPKGRDGNAVGPLLECMARLEQN